ncbi:uncharacterized protein LOC116254846 [Nymphaea colorata]|nr:uncharacterized protein LOC116254846 [Nymphaea colorata]
MASTRSPVTPASNSRAKICRKPLTPKNMPATNSNVFPGSRETSCKWIAIPIAGAPDKENHQMGPMIGSAGKDFQLKKREDESPVVLAENRHKNDRWITIPLFGDKEDVKVASKVEAEKVEIVVNNDMDASLGEELSVIRQRNDRLRAEKAKTEEVLTARDQAIKKMEEELEAWGKAQEKLEMDLLQLIRLKELKDCINLQPVESLRERQQSKRKREAPLQVYENSPDECSVNEAPGHMPKADKVI